MNTTSFIVVVLVGIVLWYIAQYCPVPQILQASVLLGVTGLFAYVVFMNQQSE